MDRPVKSLSVVSADRLIMLPAHLKKKLEGSDVYIALDPFERSVHVYTQQEWNELVKYLKSQPSKYVEMWALYGKIAASAYKTKLDVLGRLFIPESFERHTGISVNIDVVIVDQIGNFEIMTVSEWDALIDPSSYSSERYADYICDRIRNLTDETA